MIRRVATRRHVNDDEAIDKIRELQRRVHGGFAPHRVAKERGESEIMLMDKVAHVLRHHVVVEAVGMGTVAVVALVDGEDMGLFGEASAAERVPVAVGAEEAVKDDEQRSRLAVFGVV